jgi:hypothetical protein
MAARSSSSTTRNKSSRPVNKQLGSVLAPAFDQRPALVSSTPSSVSTNNLAEDTTAMESRLAALKAAMNVERAKRAELTELAQKSKGGTLWKSARPIQANNYVEDVMKRIENRKIKQATVGDQPAASSILLSNNPAIMANAPIGAKKTASPTPAPARGNKNISKPTAAHPKAATSTAAVAASAAAKPNISSLPVSKIKPVAGSNSSSSPPISNSTRSAAKSQYVAPVNAKSAVSESFLIASTQWLAEADKDEKSNSYTSKPSIINNETKNRGDISVDSSSGVDTTNDLEELAEGAPGSLLSGNYSEADNRGEFQQARLEWLKTVQGSNEQAAKITATPLPAASNTTTTGASTSTVNSSLAQREDEAKNKPFVSLLDGPAFDERENAREFAQARAEFLHSLQPNKPLEPVAAPANSSNLSSGGASSSSKLSCWTCYKQFYSDKQFLEPQFQDKSFCGENCAKEFVKANIVNCLSCNKAIDRKLAKRGAAGHNCAQCAQEILNKELQHIQQNQNHAAEATAAAAAAAATNPAEHAESIDNSASPAKDSENNIGESTESAISQPITRKREESDEDEDPQATVPVEPIRAPSPEPQLILAPPVMSSAPITTKPVIEFPDD